jgi:hypothetical protein
MAGAFLAMTNQGVVLAQVRQLRMYAVVHLSSRTDRIGHAFVVFEDLNGVRTGYGFWPASPILEYQYGDFLTGTVYQGQIMGSEQTCFSNRRNR